ncbi:HipA N-terminal domain-containing protein [Burkholderia sp. YR290]|uniref:HipA domain-containing protein n=1 Tax=Paraburkholderia hospita TaxID=169430 RepID=UPI000271B719|nr:HipA domain-containing protein [Paraburkholderia hospita]EUC13727.1 HipA N-terminal domain protein [Burkholderia sp. BT03]SKC91527.1 HipA N-terminal domain-containing protein [Paraburkholderia hospita]SOE69080.1 HipA N-terminal domain-containing protein [Burkholderia sp. YR290]
MPHDLHVTAHEGAVGRLDFDARQSLYRFTYDANWPGRRHAFPLSPHIPLSGDEPPGGAVHRFIANLLPEGRALDVASVVYQVSKDNTYGLIRMLGKEPVGALSFLATDDDGKPIHPEERPPARREISPDELSQRIRERDVIPFPVWDGKVRLSVAGYQDKLQVLVEGERIALADGPLSSTHILKPESRSPVTPCMVANEHYCMTLASRMGLLTAPVSIRRIPEPILLIGRFDRKVELDPSDGESVQAVRRRHVIDGCQALDLPVTFKYERNFGNTPDVRNIREGVSFEKLFALQRHLDNPAAARTFMIRWALFQLLIGNSDAHGKNLSFFMHGGGLEPAPLYDLVSVNAYGERVEQDMAMGYGEAFRLEDITPFALADFARRTGTVPRFLGREMTRMAQAAKALAPDLARSDVYVGDERALVHTISDFIAVQAERLLQFAPMVPQVDRKLL